MNTEEAKFNIMKLWREHTGSTLTIILDKFTDYTTMLLMVADQYPGWDLVNFGVFRESK